MRARRAGPTIGGLRRKQEAYRATGKSPSAIDLHRELNALKKSEVPWMYEVSKCAPQEALRNLDTPLPTSSAAASSRRQGKLRRASSGYPKRKTKKRGWAASGSPAPLWSFPMPFSCRAWGACA